MRCMQIPFDSLESALPRMVQAYQQAYSRSPWSERVNPSRVRKHLLRLVRDVGAELLFCECDAATIAFLMGVVLNQGNGILTGLAPFGASAGDYYLSEQVVQSGCTAGPGCALLTELERLARVRGARRIWARTHPLEHHHHELYRNFGFTRKGEYEFAGRIWVVYEKTL